MARRVLLWDRVPPEVLDGHARAGVDRSKRTATSVDRSSGKLACRQPNTSRCGGIPLAHGADLEPLAVGADLDQPLGRLGFEREAATGAVGELEQPVGTPPLADLAGERGERARRWRRDAQRDRARVTGLTRAPRGP